MLLYGAFTLFGLAVTAVIAYRTMGWAHMDHTLQKVVYDGPLNIGVLFIGTLVLGFIGVMMTSSNSAVVSFIGYMLVAGPFGLILGPAVAAYTTASVVKVLIVTGALVGVLAFVGAVIPDSLESWGAWLFGGLIILLVGQFAIPFAAWLIPGFPVQGALTFWDWVGVVLFSFYVIFDMNRACRVEPTVDNAVDAALALYLDIINLFIRLLQIMGQAKSGD
jgi:hypothetical protein